MPQKVKHTKQTLAFMFTAALFTTKTKYLSTDE